MENSVLQPAIPLRFARPSPHPTRTAGLSHGQQISPGKSRRCSKPSYPASAVPICRGSWIGIHVPAAGRSYQRTRFVTSSERFASAARIGSRLIVPLLHMERKSRAEGSGTSPRKRRKAVHWRNGFLILHRASHWPPSTCPAASGNAHPFAARPSSNRERLCGLFPAVRGVSMWTPPLCLLPAGAILSPAGCRSYVSGNLPISNSYAVNRAL